MLRIITLVTSLAVVFLMITDVTNISAGGNLNRGMVMVAMGGGFIGETMFINNDGEATFSIHGGYDKNGAFKGSFFAKRLIPDARIAAAKSTEITDIQLEVYGSGEDVYACMLMTGVVDFMPTWSNQHIPDHTFILEACDFDSFGDGVDTIWFQVVRSDVYVRPAISLLEPCEVTGGNILIPAQLIE